MRKVFTKFTLLAVSSQLLTAATQITTDHGGKNAPKRVEIQVMCKMTAFVVGRKIIGKPQIQDCSPLTPVDLENGEVPVRTFDLT